NAETRVRWKRKREDAENILPCLAGLLAPQEPGSHPHPSPRDDQTVWRHLCTNCAENLQISRRRPMRSTLRTPPRLRQPHSYFNVNNAKPWLARPNRVGGMDAAKPLL